MSGLYYSLPLQFPLLPGVAEESILEVAGVFNLIQELDDVAACREPHVRQQQSDRGTSNSLIFLVEVSFRFGETSESPLLGKSQV